MEYHDAKAVAYENAAGWLRANVEAGLLRDYGADAGEIEQCVIALSEDLDRKAERLWKRGSEVHVHDGPVA